MRGITIGPVDRFGGAVVVTDIPTDLGSMVTLVPPSIASVPSESVTVLVSPSPTGPAGLIAIATNVLQLTWALAVGGRTGATASVSVRAAATAVAQRIVRDPPFWTRRQPVSQTRGCHIALARDPRWCWSRRPSAPRPPTESDAVATIRTTSDMLIVKLPAREDSRTLKCVSRRCAGESRTRANRRVAGPSHPRW